MKTDTDKLYAIFLLKKNVQHDIIKTVKIEEGGLDLFFFLFLFFIYFSILYF